MASRKKTGARRRKRARARPASARAGAALARAVIAEREQELRRRARAIRTAVFRPRAAAARAETIPASTRARLGPPSRAILVAEGDSWFDYPFHDVLGMLEDRHGYDVESVAHYGDRVEDMAYGGGQLDAFTRRLEKLLRANKVPRAVLLSGGGNDIAGDEFATLLNHAQSGLPSVNEDIVRGIIDIRIRAAYDAIIAGVTRISQHYLKRDLPVVVHGYGRPVPDGRGYLGGWWLLPGPWLKPGFDLKGYGDRAQATLIIGKLIDRFNAMLRELVKEPAFPHVHYVDLRPSLRNDSSYKQDWDNELHPTKRGFETVAGRFAQVIASL